MADFSSNEFDFSNKTGLSCGKYFIFDEEYPIVTVVFCCGCQ